MEVEFIRHEVHSYGDTLECYCMQQTFYGEKTIVGSLSKKLMTKICLQQITMTKIAMWKEDKSQVNMVLLWYMYTQPIQGVSELKHTSAKQVYYDCRATLSQTK